MISAERMKSVLIAPRDLLVLEGPRASGVRGRAAPTFTSCAWARCGQRAS